MLILNMFKEVVMARTQQARRVYRDDSAITEWRLSGVLAHWRRETGSAAVSRHLRLHRRRSARALAGAVLAAGGMLTLGVSAAAMLLSLPRETANWLLPTFLLSAVALAVASYGVASIGVPQLARRWLSSRLVPSGDAARDLDRLRGDSPVELTSGWAARWTRASYVMPLVGIALVGPLLLHLMVATLLSGSTVVFGGFGEWMTLSAIFVGHAHLGFAWLLSRHVNALMGDRLPEHATLRMIGAVTLIAALPGVVLVGLPPLLTAVTGASLAIPMLAWARRTWAHEQMLLAAA
jgi:hypothetical protein